MAGARVSTRGRHALRSRAFAQLLVREAGVGAGDLVLDLGAGGGILTAALRDVGARVLAVELDRDLAAALRRRFAGDAAIRVADADAARVSLPDEPFTVVANLPFAHGTAILRRLLDDPAVPVRRVDAIVEWGLAEKRARVWPSTQLSCYWGAWHELSVARRVPRAAFVPPARARARLLVRRSRPRPRRRTVGRSPSCARVHPPGPLVWRRHEPFNPVQRGRKGVE